MRHPHHWTFHPFLPVAYLSDLGADLVRRYHVVGPGEIIPLEPIQQSVATGPRRTIVHPSGEALYTLHEISSSISVGKIDTSTPYGNVTVTQTEYV
jgi:6-phosphogluconolactonase (cycloisomerase 2 family)